MRSGLSQAWALTCSIALLGACAEGEPLDDSGGNPFTNSGGTSQTQGTMTTSGETSGMTGDGDGDPGDGDPGDGDGDPTGPSECGNDIKEGDEECDGNDLGGLDCSDFNFQDGTLVCAADCTLFTNACSTCGDGQLAPTEVCDGNNFGGLTCTDLGYDGGVLGCASDCSALIESGCMQAPDCGNGVLDPGEACDGGNLNGQNCQSLGFDGGQLVCTNGCMFDSSGCTVDPNMCVPILGACNFLFDDCCEGLFCAVSFCLPQN